MATPSVLLSVGDGATADHLNLMNGTDYRVLSAGILAPMPSPGALERILTMPLRIYGTSSNDLIANAAAIELKLWQAARAIIEGNTSERVTLGLQYPAATAMVYFDVFAGTLERVGAGMVADFWEDYVLTLRCLPHARAAAINDTVTGTLSHTSTQFLRADVPGDVPALVNLTIVDNSVTGVVNRIRAAVRSATSAVLGDFDPWVDVAALAGATDTVDATAFGGSYATRTLTTTTHSDLARATMPAGALNKGRFDLWARVYDTATAQAAPTTLTATVTGPRPAIGATGTARTTSGTTIAPSWSAATVAGSLLLIVLLTQQDGNPTTPAGWTLVDQRTQTGEVGNELEMTIFAIQNASSRSGSQSITVGATATAGNPTSAALIEVQNVHSFALINETDTDSTTDTSEPSFTSTDTTVFEHEVMLAIFGTAGAATADLTGFWYGGFEGVSAVSANELTIGIRDTPADLVGDTVRARVRLTASMPAWMGYILHIRPPAEDATELEGTLAAGSYGFRVQAVDPTGMLSDATATTTASVDIDGSTIALAWTAPSGTVSYYKITYSFGGKFYYFYTLDSTTSYTLTTTEGHAQTTALPATSGASAPLNWMRVRVGTTGTPSADLLDLPEVSLPGAGAWRHVKLASCLDLPPNGEHLDGTRPEWAIEVQARTSNARSGVIRIDALWLTPHDEPQATIEYSGLGLATKRRWVVESDRSGRAMTGRLEDTGTSAEVGTPVCAGALTLPPGDCIIALCLEQASGLSTLDASVTVQVDVIPRYTWQKGA